MGLPSTGIKGAILSYGALVMANLIFGFAPIPYKHGLKNISPVVFTFYRQLGATPILEIVALLKSGVFPETKDFIWFIAVGFSGVFVNQFLYILSMYFAGALLATILQLLSTPLTAGLAILMKMEKASILKILGIGCSIIGAGVMTGLGGIKLDKSKIIGMCLAITQAFFGAFFVVFSKRKLLSKYPPLTVTAGIHVTALPFITIACFSIERDLSKYVIPKVSFISVAYAVLFHSVLAYILLMFVNSRIDASMVSAFGTLNPLFGTTLSVIVLKEKFMVKDGIGGALILLGLGCVVFQRMRESKQVEIKESDIEIALKEIEIDHHKDEIGEDTLKPEKSDSVNGFTNESMSVFTYDSMNGFSSEDEMTSIEEVIEETDELIK